ncbi:hypothetical protein QLQ09_23910, partial [Brucella sp. NM4]
FLNHFQNQIAPAEKLPRPEHTVTSPPLHHNLKAEEDKELIQRINSTTNGASLTPQPNHHTKSPA